MSWNEKSQIQALNRFQPILPMMPGTPERRSHDYVRHGTTSLFAALDMATGKVIGSLHKRHRGVEFKKFLVRIDEEVPRHPRRAIGVGQLLDPQDARDPPLAGTSPAVPPWKSLVVTRVMPRIGGSGSCYRTLRVSNSQVRNAGASGCSTSRCTRRMPG